VQATYDAIVLGSGVGGSCKWPGFRTVPVNPVPHRTPVKGLFNVGDACCPRGLAGSMDAAKSALLVRDDLRRAS